MSVEYACMFGKCANIRSLNGLIRREWAGGNEMEWVAMKMWRDAKEIRMDFRKIPRSNQSSCSMNSWELISDGSIDRTRDRKRSNKQKHVHTHTNEQKRETYEFLFDCDVQFNDNVSETIAKYTELFIEKSATKSIEHATKTLNWSARHITAQHTAHSVF